MQRIQEVKYLTCDAACELMRVSRSTFYQAKLRGDLPEPVFIGKRPYYLRDEIEGLSDVRKTRGRKKHEQTA